MTDFPSVALIEKTKQDMNDFHAITTGGDTESVIDTEGNQRPTVASSIKALTSAFEQSKNTSIDEFTTASIALLNQAETDFEQSKNGANAAIDTFADEGDGLLVQATAQATRATLSALDAAAQYAKTVTATQALNAIQGVLPDAPSLALDFNRNEYAVVNNASIMEYKQFSDVVDFTGSGGTYFDDQGDIQIAADNVPRLTHDPLTLKTAGVLIEEARTNLVAHAACSTVNWFASGGADVSDLVLNALGTFPGVQVAGANSWDGLNLNLEVNFIEGKTYAVSVIFRLGSSGRVSVRVRGTWAGGSGECNVAGEVDALISAGVSLGEAQDISCSLFADGVTYLVAYNFTALATATSSSIRISSDSSLGDIIAFAAQVEEGASASSIILTDGVAVTRTADVAKNISLPSWYNPDEGTWLINYRDNVQNESTKYALSLGVGNSSKFIIYKAAGDANSMYRYGVLGHDASPVFGYANYGAFAQDVVAAVSYAAGDFAACGNGQEVDIGAGGSLAIGLDQLVLGSKAGNSDFLNSTICSVRYYPRKLSNIALQLLTSFKDVVPISLPAPVVADGPCLYDNLHRKNGFHCEAVGDGTWTVKLYGTYSFNGKRYSVGNPSVYVTQVVSAGDKWLIIDGIGIRGVAELPNHKHGVLTLLGEKAWAATIDHYDESHSSRVGLWDGTGTRHAAEKFTGAWNLCSAVVQQEVIVAVPPVDCTDAVKAIENMRKNHLSKADVGPRWFNSDNKITSMLSDADLVVDSSFKNPVVTNQGSTYINTFDDYDYNAPWLYTADLGFYDIAGGLVDGAYELATQQVVLKDMFTANTFQFTDKGSASIYPALVDIDTASTQVRIKASKTKQTYIPFSDYQSHVWLFSDSCKIALLGTGNAEFDGDYRADNFRSNENTSDEGWADLFYPNGAPVLSADFVWSGVEHTVNAQVITRKELILDGMVFTRFASPESSTTEHLFQYGYQGEFVRMSYCTIANAREGKAGNLEFTTRDGWYVDHVDFSGFSSDFVEGGNVTVESCYTRDPSLFTYYNSDVDYGGAHLDYIQVSGGVRSNVTHKGNWFDVHATFSANHSWFDLSITPHVTANVGGGGVTCSMIFTHNAGVLEDSIIEGCMLNGGAYVLFLDDGGLNNVTVRNNVVGGVYGFYRVDSGATITGLVWENNRCNQTGLLLPDPERLLADSGYGWAVGQNNYFTLKQLLGH